MKPTRKFAKTERESETLRRKYNQAEKLVGNAQYFYVSVITKDFDRDNEYKMEKLAKSLNGYESGSGWGGERDISYVFVHVKDAKKFLTKIKNHIFKRKTTITKYVLDWADNGRIKI